MSETPYSTEKNYYDLDNYRFINKLYDMPSSCRKTARMPYNSPRFYPLLYNKMESPSNLIDYGFKNFKSPLTIFGSSKVAGNPLSRIKCYTGQFTSKEISEFNTESNPKISSSPNSKYGSGSGYRTRSSTKGGDSNPKKDFNPDLMIFPLEQKGVLIQSGGGGGGRGSSKGREGGEGRGSSRKREVGGHNKAAADGYDSGGVSSGDARDDSKGGKGVKGSDSSGKKTIKHKEKKNLKKNEEKEIKERRSPDVKINDINNIVKVEELLMMDEIVDRRRSREINPFEDFDFDEEEKLLELKERACLKEGANNTSNGNDLDITFLKEESNEEKGLISPANESSSLLLEIDADFFQRIFQQRKNVFINKNDDDNKVYNEVNNLECDEQMMFLEEKCEENMREGMMMMIGRDNGLEKTQKIYKCKFCNKAFTKGCSLGGHISTLHKGKSMTFKDKIKKRNDRAKERLRVKFLKRDAVRRLNS